MAEETILVRVKPYDKNLGHLRRRQGLAGIDITFDAERGWYERPAHERARFEKCRQNENNPQSPCVFDICTHAEAEALEEAGRAAQVATARTPIQPLRRHRAPVADEDVRTRARAALVGGGPMIDGADETDEDASGGDAVGGGDDDTISDLGDVSASEGASKTASRGPSPRRRRKA